MDHWDWTKVKDILEVLVILWGFISGAIVLWLRGQFVTRKTFDDTVKRLDEATAACRAAGTGEATSLAMAVERLTGTLGRIEERGLGDRQSMVRLITQVDRIESFLLESKAA